MGERLIKIHLNTTRNENFSNISLLNFDRPICESIIFHVQDDLGTVNICDIPVKKEGLIFQQQLAQTNFKDLTW